MIIDANIAKTIKKVNLSIRFVDPIGRQLRQIDTQGYLQRTGGIKILLGDDLFLMQLFNDCDTIDFYNLKLRKFQFTAEPLNCLLNSDYPIPDVIRVEVLEIDTDTRVILSPGVWVERDGYPTRLYDDPRLYNLCGDIIRRNVSFDVFLATFTKNLRQYQPTINADACTTNASANQTNTDISNSQNTVDDNTVVRRRSKETTGDIKSDEFLKTVKNATGNNDANRNDVPSHKNDADDNKNSTNATGTTSSNRRRPIRVRGIIIRHI